LDFEIRSADPADAEPLSALALRAKSSWGYPSEWLARWSDDLTLTAEYLATNPGFVAVENGTPIGVCVLQEAGGGATLEHVWVDPECHGRGVGRELVQRALARARDLGLERVEVHSDPFAEEFYLRLGARRIGSIPAPQPGAATRTLPLLEFTLENSNERRPA